MPGRALMILLGVLCTHLVGCGSGGDESVSYEVRGEVVSVVYNGLALRIDHEPIDGYMDAMRMNFRLESPEDSRGLEPGDRIRFIYMVAPGGNYIRDIERLPPDTELDLDDIPERTSQTDAG